MPAPSVTYTFSNGTTADATQVNQNFTDLINGLSDGTKDLTISALTAGGTVTCNGDVTLGNASGDTITVNGTTTFAAAASFNGNVTLGNASSDDITVTGSIASTIPIKTNTTYDIGSSTKGLATLYLGGGTTLTAAITAASHSTASRVYTVPDCGTNASFVMTQQAQTIAGVKTFSSGIVLNSNTLSDYVAPVVGDPTSKFSDTGTGTWTVDGGDVTIYHYAIVGKLMYFWLQLDGTSVTGTVTAFIVTLPASKTAAFTTTHTGILNDNSTTVLTDNVITVTGTTATMQKADGSAFAASSNNTYIRMSLVIPIQ